MEHKDVHFYKLNISKRYGVEGAYIKIGETVLLGFVFSLFWAVIIAAIIVNLNVLFSDVLIIVFIFVFIVILSVLTAFACIKFAPILKKRIHAHKLLKNCTLTDGTVVDLQKQKSEHLGTSAAHHKIYYRVYLKYCFHGLDGALRYGEYMGNYGEVPFFVGQNLMIAYNDTDSLILNKFTLSDGADEFALAEAERERVDFTGLTGNLIKVDLLKPISVADYDSLFIKAKRRKRLKRILQDFPRFTIGICFIKKGTYRYNAGNTKYYCFIQENGNKRVGECTGICNVKDGDEVTVAYGNGVSEIISHYTLKQSFPKPRRNKSV
ncbi:MAG: hypothetical protein K2O89_00905 [Clostridia bacterium]|nr:hypothetical protein [Clostridia bacterium]